MNSLNHAGILKAGRYRDERVGAGETDVARALHAFMIRLRLCEEALAAEYHPADEMRCPIHFCVGQEAVPAALSLLLSPDDYLFSHHRSHGYYLAKHAPMEALFAELYGKSTGANGGLAGSQDISYPGCNFFSGAILSGAVAISTGAALGLQLQKSAHVAVAGFGESATDEGIFWETINYAAVARLPVVFVCENNNYSVFSPQVKRQALDNLSARVETFGVRSRAVFGNDAMEVYRVLAREIAVARAGGGPAFVEAYTYRWSGHYGPAGDDLVGYRDGADLAAWKENCPIELLEEAMRAAGVFDSGLKKSAVRNAQAEIDRCFALAKSAPFPVVSDWETLNRNASSPLADKLLVEVELSGGESAAGLSASDRPVISYAEAINEGLRQAMELSDRVVVIGQLVDYSPGVFGTTTGLVERFGGERVRDFPVAESAMTAAAIGAAVVGMRPVLVHHRLDFMLYSMDAITNWLALWRFKSNGQSAAPVVIRAIVGRGWGQGPQHSKSLQAWFAHIPGLKVAMPATAFDAKGLLLESIFGEDPVVIIEHRSLFALEDRVPAEPYRVRFGRSAIRRSGEDLTIAAIGVMVPFALRVAGRLAVDGIAAEVIDLRTISPLDTGSIVASVQKTGRLCVMDPAWRSFGVSAEIVARVVEAAGGALRATPLRICQPDSHTPMSSALEAAYYPDEQSVVKQLCELVRRG